MARKANGIGFDDLEEMRKDIDKLGEAMHVTPPRIRTPVPAPKGPSAKPAPGSPLLRALARKRPAKARKDSDHA